MKTLLLAVLTALTATASAQPCKPTGAVLFEIDHQVEGAAKGTTGATKLYDNGAWTRDLTDADGKHTTGEGCLAKTELQTIRKDLQASPWKITHPKFHCLAISASYTVFRVKGKPVFTQKVCSNDILDDKSQKNLDAVIKILDAAK